MMWENLKKIQKSRKFNINLIIYKYHIINLKEKGGNKI